MRFDDLDPPPVIKAPAHRDTPIVLRRAVTAASATRASIGRVVRDTGRGAWNAIASARRQAVRVTAAGWRTSAVALAAAGRASARGVRAGAHRFAGALSFRRVNRR